MLNAGQSGFVHAPVTKTFITAIVVATVVSSIVNSKSHLLLQIKPIISSLQLWRLFSPILIFTTPGELLFGVVLLYFFRSHERQVGSSRYAAFLLIVTVLHTALLVTVLFLLASDFAPRIIHSVLPAPGPYAVVFACLVRFFFETPAIYRFRIIGGIELNDKSIVYLLAVQLVLSCYPHSLLPAAAAILVGVVYRLPPLRDHADIPAPVVNICSTYILPLLDTMPRPSSHTRPNRRPRPPTATATAHAIVPNPATAGPIPIDAMRAANASAPVGDGVSIANAGGGHGDSRVAVDAMPPLGVHDAAESDDDMDVDDDDDDPLLRPASPPPVSDDNVDTLVAMGFSREAAMSALRRSHDDVQSATELLLRAADDT